METEQRITMGVFSAFLKSLPITIGVVGLAFGLGDYRASDKATVESLSHQMGTLQLAVDRNRETTDELGKKMERLITQMEDQREGFKGRIR